MGGTGVESTENEGGNALLKTQLTRRTAVTAAAWSAPVVAMAAATPAVAASGTFEVANLSVAALGGAEGRYQTKHDFTSEAVSPPNRDFRRAFSVNNKSKDGASFSGTLRVNFQYPGMWNNPRLDNGQSQGDESAFNNWGTVDLGGRGGSIGGKTDWKTTVNPAPKWWVNNEGPHAWDAVHMRMDYAYVDLTSIFHDGPDRGLSAPVVSMLV